jgi:hypothetical protein
MIAPMRMAMIASSTLRITPSISLSKFRQIWLKLSW